MYLCRFDLRTILFLPCYLYNSDLNIFQATSFTPNFTSMTQNVFISYSVKNQQVAFSICDMLESKEVSCWIMPRNEIAGVPYAMQIINGIKSADVTIFVCSAESNISEHVHNEINIAFENKKIIIPFIIDDVALCDELKYYLNRTHQIHAHPNYTDFFPQLYESVCSAIQNSANNGEAARQTVQNFAKAPIEEQSSHIFNEHFTKMLILNSAEQSNAIHKFYEIIKNIPDWEKEQRISNKAKEIISYSFTGAIGKQINKLMAIGKEDYSEEKVKKYILKCHQIAFLTLELSLFTLMSKLWDFVNQGLIQLSGEQRERINQRFIMSNRLDLPSQVQLLEMLTGIISPEIYERNSLLKDICLLRPSLSCDSELFATCQALETLKSSSFSVANCSKAEDFLSKFLIQFNFFMKYKTISMKQIGYSKHRGSEAHYIHRYIAVGLDNKSNVDAEKAYATAKPSYTESVLIYKDQLSEDEAINLFPFVFDYNAITNEHGSKLCFFYLSSVTSDKLDYLSIEEGKTFELTKQETLLSQDSNLSETLNKANVTAYNINNIIDSFTQLQACLSGSTFIDFGDL